MVKGVFVWFEKTDFALEETEHMQATDESLLNSNSPPILHFY